MQESLLVSGFSLPLPQKHLSLQETPTVARAAVIFPAKS